MSSGVEQLSKVTQQNAANAEELAAAAEELNGQAMELQNLVAQFTLSENGRTRRQPAKIPNGHPAKSLLHQNGEDKTRSGELIPLSDDEEGVLSKF